MFGDNGGRDYAQLCKGGFEWHDARSRGDQGRQNRVCRLEGEAGQRWRLGRNTFPMRMTRLDRNSACVKADFFCLALASVEFI
jgi:hypothetical protein